MSLPAATSAGSLAGAGSSVLQVIIPTRNEVGFIGRCLEAVLANDYPAELVEIVVADGMSDDGTRDVLREIVEARSERRVRVIDNPQRTTPQALNLAILAATGRFIIRVDGHSEIYPDYLRRCVTLLETVPRVGCVGGLFENVSSTLMGRVISLALSSPFGVGNAAYRLAGREGEVDTVPFGAFPREVFDRVGLFDEELVRNQDDEFTYRLRRAGYVVWLSPSIRVKYHTRGTLWNMARQFAQYGLWKVYVNRKLGAVTTLRQLAPPVFVATLVAGAIGSVFNPWIARAFVALVVAYVIAAVVAAVCKTWEPRRIALLVVCFLVLHASYGSGYLAGIWRFLVLNAHPEAARAELTR